MTRRPPRWQITVLSHDGQQVLFHAACEDRKECQCLATEARHLSRTAQIWITPPAGGDFAWD